MFKCLNLRIINRRSLMLLVYRNQLLPMTRTKTAESRIISDFDFKFGYYHQAFLKLGISVTKNYTCFFSFTFIHTRRQRFSGVFCSLLQNSVFTVTFLHSRNLLRSLYSCQCVILEDQPIYHDRLLLMISRKGAAYIF